MQAVIRLGGKQLVVAEGQTFYAEKQPQEPGTVFTAPEVLALIDGAKTEVGAPTLDGVEVTLKLLQQGKHTKVKSIRFRRRKALHRVIGHRQPYSWMLVEKIARR